MWVHGVVLVLGLLVVGPFVHLEHAFSDEGTYIVQVRALDAGDWRYDYLARDLDPDGRWFPLINSTRSGDGWYPYVQHPAFPVALLGLTRAFGETAGLHVLGLLGALGVAAASWLVAAEVSTGASRLAFWLAAASPVVVNAFVVWAHAPSAAVAGFAVLAALRIRRAPHSARAHLVLLAASVVGGVLLRSEGLLFALAVVAGLVWMASREPSDSERRSALVTGAMLAAGLAAGTAWLERRWTSAIIGRGYRPLGFRDTATTSDGPIRQLADLAAGRAEGLWHSILEGAYNHPTGTVMVTAALVLSGFAVRSLRRQAPGWERDVAGALTLAAGLYLARLLIAPDQSITGLAAAWPVALVGLGAMARVSPGVGTPLVVISVLFALGVAASQYRDGGGLQWGGRFFSPLLVPVAVLAALGLRHLGSQMHAGTVWGPVALAALAVVPPVTGLVMLRSSRPLVGAVVAEVVAEAPGLVLTDSPVLPRAAWRTYPETAWMLVPPGEFGQVAQKLGTGGAGELVVVAALGGSSDVHAAFPGARNATGPGASRLGWKMFLVPGAVPR